MVCFLGWLDGGLCLWFLASAFVHELGHIVMIRLCRGNIEKIILGAFGAVIQVGYLDYRSELRCALSGPAAGVLFSLLMLRLWPQAAIISFLLSAANLLPIYPLDGGRILRACLMLWCSVNAAERIYRMVSDVVCCILMLLACSGTVFLKMGLWPIFLSMILLWRGDRRE